MYALCFASTEAQHRWMTNNDDDDDEEHSVVNKSFRDLNSNENTNPTERRRIGKHEKKMNKNDAQSHKMNERKKNPNQQFMWESLHSKLILSMIDGWTAAWLV